MNEAALGLAEDPQPVSSKNRLSRPTHHSQSNSTGLRSAVQNGDFFFMFSFLFSPATDAAFPLFFLCYCSACNWGRSFRSVLCGRLKNFASVYDVQLFSAS